MNNKNTGKGIFFEKRREVLVSLFLVVVTLAVYWQMGNHKFIDLDADMYVTENSIVLKGLTLNGVIWSFTTAHFNWHPITWLSHMLDVQIYGTNPGAHHLTNLHFHIANTLLLFFVLTRMTGAFWRSISVAALFALHPLQVEPVAWLAARKDVLSTFFLILTMLCYIRYVESQGVIRYLVVILFFILGLMSKAMLVSLPFVLLLLDFWPLGRVQLSRANGESNPAIAKARNFHLVWEKIPLFAISIVMSVATIFAQQKVGAVKSLVVFPLKDRMANALVSYASYIGKFFWPHHLAVFYPHPGTIPIWQTAGAFLLLVCLSVLLLRGARRFPYLAVGWLWYLGTLVPVIGVVQVGGQAMADRYTYVPLIGLFVIIAWGVPDLLRGFRHRRIALAIASATMFSCLMMCTWLQLGHWKNSVALFEHTINVTENNFVAHNNLGVALMRQGKLKEAIRHYHEALRIRPMDPEPHSNLGNALMLMGKLKEAIRHYHEALRIKPGDAKAHNNLGVALMRQGKLKEAIRHYHEALRIKPDYANAHNNLGLVLARKRMLDEAIRHYHEALRIKPGDAKIHTNLGVALMRQGRLKEAITHFSEAIRIEPDYARAQNNLELVLRQIGKPDEASKTINNNTSVICDE